MKSLRSYCASIQPPKTIAVIASLAVLILSACSVDTPFTSVSVSPTPPLKDDFVQKIIPAGIGYLSADMEIYFTNPASPFAYRREDGIDEIIANSIDAAKVSVDIAIYGFDLYSIQKAVQDAHNRGVSVRIVTESDNIENYSIIRLKDAGIPVVDDGQNGLMHNKFVIIDGTQVWTGSANFSEESFYLDNNVMILLRDTKIAQNYLVEFEELFTDKLFGTAGDIQQPFPVVSMGPILIKTFFSPDDTPVRPIVGLIQNAQKEINFYTYALTGEDFGDALLVASANGVLVEGIFDDQLSTNAGSQLPGLLSAGLPMWIDPSSQRMHQKVMVIDQTIVIVGSYNFSANAEKHNDENLLVIESPAVAQIFLDEFTRLKLISEKQP